jgi:serine/threonine protein kinase
MGTLAYMSPEQIRADKVDHRTDIWAVGIVLHELTWGEHPLAPFGPGWIRSLFEFDVPLPQSIGSPEASALANVITQCLKKRRDERMATAEELLAVLEKIADDARSPAYHVSSNA